ncbi:MAG: EAL domain-containing protein [Porticoccaceae bacterium]|nr:EAL domain-containing protein [Porticoccaceae bacterium]
MRKAFFSKLEFWQQLVISFSLGIAVLAISTSIVLTVTANKTVKNQITDQGLFLTESIARQSRLALLYKSAEEAQTTANIALQFPDVAGIKITTETGEALYSKGMVFDEKEPLNIIVPRLLQENNDYLVFISPVKTKIEEEPDFGVDSVVNTKNAEIIGFVTLVISKETLKSLWSQLLKSNFFVSTLVASLLLIMLIALSRRLTIPLRLLANVMRESEKGDLTLRASFKGPVDIQNMQKAFNTMMTALETRTIELQKARDKALESGKIKSEFAANVSHELRTPMNSVLGMLDLLSVMELGDQQYEYVETAKLSAQNLLALIDDILSYVRSDSGKLVLDSVPCKLDEILEDVVILLSPQALKKKLDIGYVIYGNIDQVTLDAQRFRQILINLIGNAIKFTEFGEVFVSVDCQNLSSGNMKVSVKDTGIGIGKDAQQKIFEAFTQEDSSTTRRYGGTGLGLAICKQFVELMGGSISIASDFGEGSEFILTIPLISYTFSGTNEVPKLLVGRKIIVADNSNVVRNYLKNWLEFHGAQVELCLDAVGLINFLKEEPDFSQKTDYVFVDEDIPGAHVNDLIPLIKQLDYMENTNIVVMVNPWIISRDKVVNELLIIEKPLFNTRLINFFSNQTQMYKITNARNRSKNLISEKLNINVLVVDDNHSNCLVAGGMLNQLGCEYEFSYDGQDALDKILRKQFDLILMDCNMPVMDGYVATEKIRKLQNSSKMLPVIAMTANNTPEERQRCLSSGMNDFIAKPLSVDALYKMLSKWYLKSPDENNDKRTDGNDSASYDISVVQSLRQSVGEVFNSVVDAFVEDTPVYLDALKAAINKGDSQQIYELSHTIKGSSSNFGALKVSSLAKTIEDKGKNNDLSDLDQLYRDLVVVVRALIKDLVKYAQNCDKSNLSAMTRSTKNIPTVLVADDDRSIRLAFSNALRDEGYRIAEASNGQNALALCSRSMPDLILIDAIMPEMDGFLACKKIRAMTSGVDVPILMVTSLEDEKSISRAFLAGATDYITKPVNFSVLRQRVSRLLQASKAEKHVRKLAYHDVLTGLPNRAYFNQQLRHKINRANLNNKKVAILFLDLDRFKVINDSLGHDTGDLILKAAAKRISNCVRDDDFVARLGGDEFTIVLENLEVKQLAAEISEKIAHSLGKPFVFNNQQLFISASIGIAIYPDDGHNSVELVRHADIAMFKAKESDRIYCYYTQGMGDEVLRKLEIENDMRSAIANKEIVLFYQPQVDILSGALRGVEALVRWHHPTKGLLTAAQFVPVIEETNLICDLGDVVLHEACQQLEKWHAKGFDVRIAVNVSGGEFRDGRLRHRIFELLDKYSFPPHLLEIEITESILMDQPELVQTELAKIRERGICIAIDDFGSGFSSLNYLKRFSVDILKIDREFIKDCHKDKNDRAIISGIIALSKSLNLKVVAEGVELDEQMAFLRSTGCDFVQGYLTGKPATATEINDRYANFTGVD